MTNEELDKIYADDGGVKLHAGLVRTLVEEVTVYSTKHPLTLAESFLALSMAIGAIAKLGT